MPVACLPRSLSQAIALEASRLPQGDLVHAAQSLSLAYRREGAALPARLNHALRTAYLAMRFPATYAAVSTALTELNRVTDRRIFHSCLDVGAGPGTASCAAHGVWPSITTFRQLERDQGWFDVADQLSEVVGIQISRLVGNLPTIAIPAHDLVIAAYALNEVPTGIIDAAIKHIWSATSAALVVVEPGTPHGFGVVRRVREICLEQGGHAAAPCTHDATCPMTTHDWCHRIVRIERSALHRRLKDAQLAFEDEKFSFVVITREPPHRLAPSRIVRRPIRASGHVHLDLCTDTGLHRTTVTRADRAAYKATRDVDWGDLWSTAPTGGGEAD